MFYKKLELSLNLHTCSAVYPSRMNRFATLLGLLAIVVNTVMGSSSTMLFCEHESGGGHLIALAEHSAEAHDGSHHSHSEFEIGEHSHVDDCDSCTDTKVDNDDSPEVVRSSSQDRVSAPQVAEVEFAGNDLLESLKPNASRLSPLNRAPPAIDPFSAILVKRTVLVI